MSRFRIGALAGTSAPSLAPSAAPSAAPAPLDARPLGAFAEAGALPAAGGDLRSDQPVPGIVAPAPDGPVSNGSGGTTFAVTATGDMRIDGLLAGSAWAGGSITYSFPDQASDYQAGHPEAFSNFAQLTAAQQLAAHFALNDFAYTQPAAATGFSVEGLTGLSITLASDGAGTIRLANTSNPGTAYAYYPSNGVAGGDVFFGPSGSNPVMGNYHWHTVLHEIGHALGLKHGQETGGFGALPYGWDSMEFSVMTYKSYVGDTTGGYDNEAFGYAQTYMMLDIAALQQMYGADYTTNAGNTVYSWTPTSGNTYVNGAAAITPGGNRIFMTIWDGGGIDTYDMSAYATGVNINLAPGGYSTASSAQRAYLGGGNYARGNVFNAMLYQGNEASLIENAIGGSGSDTLTGNNAHNVLTGNDGNDMMDGLNGNDTLFGGAGNDTLWGYVGSDNLQGGDGNDIIAGEGDADYLLGGNGNDYISGGLGNDNIYGNAGIDTLYGGDGDDYLSAGSGTEIDAVADGGAGADFVSYISVTRSGLTFDLAAGQVRDGTVVLGTIAGAETLSGSSGDDVILSDANAHVFYGNGGNDTMVAAAGAETMDGGSGIDTLDLSVGNFVYVIDLATGASNYGFETHTNFENVILGSAADTVSGTAGDNVIDGGLGADSMTGLGGNDTYVVRDAGDMVVEALGGGTDLVQAWVDWTLGVNVENLTLMGLVKTGIGNAGDNVIYGNATGNTINGMAGNDTMAGYGGNDKYFVDSVGDVVVEGNGEGRDQVVASVSHTLASNVENLTLTGNGGLSGTGNSLKNLMVGNRGGNLLSGLGDADTLLGGDGADQLLGGSGDDRLDGQAGADTLTGGNGADSFLFALGADTITDFVDNVDTVVLDDALWGSVAKTVSQILAYASVIGGDTVFNFGGGNTLVVAGLADKTLLADDLLVA